MFGSTPGLCALDAGSTLYPICVNQEEDIVQCLRVGVELLLVENLN